MHSVPDPSCVRFAGPLAPFAAGLAAELADLGYTRTSATAKLQLAAQLSRWLQATGTDLAALTPAAAERFLTDRRRDYASVISAAVLEPVLGYLQRAGVVPAPPEPPPPTAERAADVLLERFGGYLAGQRALTAPVVRAYQHWAGPFAEEVLCRGEIDRPGELTAADVSRFLAGRLPGMSRKSAQMTACALRSLLRFLHAGQVVASDLSGVVPPVASWRLSGLPKALAPEQVQGLRDACDLAGPAGKRDLAAITMMTRLGLRCAETAGLLLDDIDWVSGTVIIRGKGSRVDRLPLPEDAGQALADYLVHDRPDIPSRAVFIRVRAPHTAMRPSSISCIVARAAQRAGLGMIHGHRLRHTAATDTLNAGASLEEVAQLLRHEGVATTVVYAKTDRCRLAQLSRPWPAEGAGR